MCILVQSENWHWNGLFFKTKITKTKKIWKSYKIDSFSRKLINWGTMITLQNLFLIAIQPRQSCLKFNGHKAANVMFQTSWGSLKIQKVFHVSYMSCLYNGCVLNEISKQTLKSFIAHKRLHHLKSTHQYLEINSSVSGNQLINNLALQKPASCYSKESLCVFTRAA